MPDFDFTSPEGKTYTVTGPEGATREQAFDILQQRIRAGTAQPVSTGQAPAQEAPAADKPFNQLEHDTELGNSLITAAKNVPGSALNFGHSLIQPIIHPIQTAEDIGKLGAGILEMSGLKQSAGNEKYAQAVGQFFKNRYGGWSNIRKTFETDPVGFLADLSAVASGGGLAAARAPGMVGQVGEVLQTVGRMTDPLIGASKAVGAGVRGAAYPIGVMSGGGHQALQTAERAGYEGGQAGEVLRANMRGNEPMAQAVTEARGAVDQLYKERGAEYVKEMAKIKADTTPLDWSRVDNALANVSQIKVHPAPGGPGLIMDEATQAVRQAIGKKVIEWKNAIGPNPTMADLDALKQTIYNMKNLPEFHEHSASQAVVSQATKAIGDTIKAHNPAYAKIMEGYETASNQINEIEHTLSLNPNASVDTALRKLQSTLRDNVNTNFGQRRTLAEFLVQHGAPHLMERLAGQSLNPVMPRGLSRLLAGEVSAGLMKSLGPGAATAAGAATFGGLPVGGASLLTMSPRLMGEVAHGIGRARRGVEAVGGAPAYVPGRLSEQLNPRAMIQEDAKALLTEGGFSGDDARILQRASRGTADSSVMLRAKEIIERTAARHEAKMRGSILQPAAAPSLTLPQIPPPQPAGAQTPAPGESSYQGPQ